MNLEVYVESLNTPRCLRTFKQKWKKSFVCQARPHASLIKKNKCFNTLLFQAFPNFGFGGDGGFQFSFGIGAFPFGIFASTFNFNDGRPAARELC